MILRKDYAQCLSFIDKHWKNMTFYFPKDKKHHIGVPNRFVAPNSTYFKNDLFYWDSYFIILGLVASGRVKLAKGMVDNFVHIYKRFKIIPTRNRLFNLGTSQAPFLTSMIREVFKSTHDRKWLRSAAKTAENELRDYWLSTNKAEMHLVHQGLSRYCDHYVNHYRAEHESGWDMTSRFNNRCLNHLPIDLNSLLYKYEKDLAEISGLLGQQTKQRKYNKQAAKRKKAVTQLMWNSKKGFFFDYDYKKGKQSSFYSVAGFYPLWAKLATRQQAENVRANLKRFEFKGGIVNTQKTGLSKEFKQHDYPNGWPHQQWIVVKGLLNYGFREDAQRITKKWLEMNKRLFLRTGEFWEKHNVVTAGSPKQGRYLNQTGFGWTNGVFMKLVKELGE